jgi:hypothetical protein
MNPAFCGERSLALADVELQLKLVAGLPLAPLRELLRATWYAQDTSRPIWDFAVSFARLVAQGLSECDLRWLSCKGLLQHAVETNEKLETSRSFRNVDSLQFVAASSFVLTPPGMRLIQRLLALETPSSAAPDAAGMPLAPAMPTPRWDQQLRELHVDTILIKRFCVPAGNQELILAAFQEEAWPARIDDPLPPVAEISCKRRLHSTIQCLNRNQRTRLLHFHGDGNGRGVRWEMLSSSPGRV